MTWSSPAPPRQASASRSRRHDQRAGAAERAVREHPALAGYLGRKVVAGIRPENLEDAALVPGADPGSVNDVQVEPRGQSAPHGRYSPTTASQLLA